ncbi:MAG: nicotinate phosphoribosyltransferase [Oscillospiraceae bacterium]|nr:nicotinate phosphoribosyltransferase [Oscillospiraceae bacterium]
MNPCLMVDAYKLGHYFMQPPGVTFVWDGWTARSNRHMPDCPETVNFGYQFTIKRYFVDFFNRWFFGEDINALEADFIKKVNNGFNPRYSDFARFRELYDLGYLPICIMGLPEGMTVPVRVPLYVIYNTDERFSWLPQYLEDLWSCHNWHPSTSATVAYDRRKILQHYVNLTCDDTTITKNLAGDFSFRGLTGVETAYISTCGHLLSFAKTATFDCYGLLQEFYSATDEDLSGIGTPSLEHSVVCQGIAYYLNILKSNGEYKGITLDKFSEWDEKLVAEMCYLKWLITELQPDGALSYVSDTFDFWGVCTKVLPELREDILAREGVLLIRPDSGDPIKICCGDAGAQTWHERQGAIRVIEHYFGSTLNSKGFKVISPKIRVIYGDAIDRQRNVAIPQGLYELKYSVENIVFGIGSLSYQWVTRDNRGYALKVTDCIMDGVEIPLYKSPKTDDGTKASQRGCFAVHYDEDGRITYTDGLTFKEAIGFKGNLMREVFRDGVMKNLEDFATIRNRLWGGEF